MKPRYILKEGKPVMANDVVEAPALGLPAYLKDKVPEGGFGDIEPGQTLLPRIKLLQATSPECASFPGRAMPGEFWHTTMEVSLGSEMIGVPIKRRQSYVLWAPRSPGETRGMLAKAVDYPHYHWEPPNTEFQVRFPMNPKTYTWNTRTTVKESGLAEFGSSRPDDPKSHPAAAVTFEVLWYLPKFETLILTLNSRGGVMAAKKLFTFIDAKRASHYYQRYKIIGARMPGPSGESYFGYKYAGDGYVDEELGKVTKGIFEQWKDAAAFDFVADEDENAAPAAAPPHDRPRDADANRGAVPMQGGMSQVIDDDIPF
jgi:hypothetical protein